MAETSVKWPAWMDAATIAWCLRRGVTMAIWMRERRVLQSFNACVIGDSRCLRMADRVTRVWLQRHPAVQVEGPDPEARPWVPTDGDARCQECGSRNPVWWTQHDTWNALMPDDGVLCPTCFHLKWLAAAALGGGE